MAAFIDFLKVVSYLHYLEDKKKKKKEICQNWCCLILFLNSGYQILASKPT